MKTSRIGFAVALGAIAVAAAVAVGPGDADAATVKRYRIARASDPASKQQTPAAFTTAPQTCEPDLGIPGSPSSPDVLGATFDPGTFDELSVTRGGKLLAYATSVSDAGAPGATKQVVLLPAGPGDTSIRVPKAGGGDDDQPTVLFDDFGYRVVFRSTASAGGEGPSTIQLYSLTYNDTEDTTATVPVTPGDAQFGTAVRSFDPTFTARVRTVEFAGDVKRRQRDAYVAFVSTGDFTLKDNPHHREQLFLWEEDGARFTQLTHHDDSDGSVNRPSMDLAGDTVFFESTADLVPGGVDPLDSSRVGNPDHVRQIFRWRRGLGVEQITWGDKDSFSPRVATTGRFVLFSSRADLFTGANPEGNLEIFEWVAAAEPHLRQITQTGLGNSVLPRPTVSPSAFVFYSTVHTPESGSVSVALFGKDPAHPDEDLPPECTPAALLFDHGRISRIHGVTDAQNALRLAATPQLNPIVTGPPAVSNSVTNVFFSTNDPRFNPRDEHGVRSAQSDLLTFFIAFATRRSR